MKRHIFKTNSSHKTTMDIGILYPFQFLDVMRGQTTILSNSALFRFQPLLSPAMVHMNAHIVSFYVPYRILWDGWNDFISGRSAVNLPLTRLYWNQNTVNIPNPVDRTISFKKSLLEYVGFPTSYVVTQLRSLDLRFPFLWFMAYHKIWNDHFRDEDLQQELDMSILFDKYSHGILVNNTDAINVWNTQFNELYGLRRVNWGVDRFTSALLEAQADPQITLPVGADGPFKLKASNGKASELHVSGVNTSSPYDWNSVDAMIRPVDGNPLTYASGLAGVDLTDFKLATSIYNFKIAQNKYGTRVEDYFRKYGIRDMDTRLKNSELIGGYADTLQISDIISTDSQDLGKQAGYAKAYSRKRRLKHYAPEDGVIISMCYIRPKAEYVGGIPRFFLKRDMLDFYQREFEDVGYQPIYTNEVGNYKVNFELPEDEDRFKIFGYENRYNEYRRETNMVTGELLPGEPLSHWANPRYWNKEVAYNENFIQCNPSDQIWASPNTDKAIVWFDRKVTKKCFLTKREDQRIKL